MTIVVSMSIMIGWLLQIKDLVQIWSGTAPVPYNTAFAFFLLGSFLLVEGKIPKNISSTILFLAAILPLLTIAEIFFNLELSIDQFFVKHFVVTDTIHPGRMSIFSALTFVIVFVNFSINRHFAESIPCRLFSVVTSFGIILTSALALMGYFLNIRNLYAFGSYTPMAFETATMFILISVILIEELWSSIQKSNLQISSFLIGILLIMCSLSGYYISAKVEEDIIKAKIDGEVQLRIDVLTQKVNELGLSLVRMAKRSERVVQKLDMQTYEELWRKDALNYAEHFKGIAGIGFDDSSSKIIWIEPNGENLGAVGFQLSSDITRKDALDQSRNSLDFALTRSVDLKQNGRGFLVVSSMHYSNKDLLGYIHSAVRYQDFFSTLFNRNDYNISVEVDGESVFRKFEETNSVSNFWESEGKLSFNNIDWLIKIKPTPATLEKLTSKISLISLFVSVFISLLIAYLHLVTKRAIGAKSELRKLADWNDSIVNGSTLSIISTNEAGIVKSFNPAAERLTGYAASEVIDIHSPGLWHDQDEVIARASQLTQELKIQIQPGFSVFTAKSVGGEVDTNLWTFVTKSGERRSVLLSIHAIRGLDNKPTGFVGVIEDVTEKLAAEKILLRAIGDAKAASIAKSQFLANMSHEIRTPINGVLGMAGLLLDTDLSETQETYASAIEYSAESLLKIVNDILDISKFEAGKVKIEEINFDLEDVVAGVKLTLGFQAREKGLLLVSAIQANVPKWVRGDPSRLRQVLINLVGNALKFTEKGRITIALALVDEDSSKVTLKFEVLDTGIGIPENARSKLFQAFSQGEDSTNRKYGGTGLGLSISANIVKAMNGAIGVETEVGKGSNFWFQIEFKNGLAESKSRKTLEATANRKLRILLADDNVINQKVAKISLEKAGHFVDVATNGIEVISALKQLSFDLILMDCHMPEMDGYEATRLIRASLGMPYKDIPIIAMTANAMPEDRENCMASGMNDYLTKPFKIKELIELLNQMTFDADQVS